MFSSQAHDKIVLIADPVVLAIPIQENGEPLVDIALTKDIPYGPSPVVPNNTNYTKMRQSVYEKLKKAQTKLPEGLRFCLYEAYRSLDVQEKIFDERYGELKKNYPSQPHEALFIESTKFVSPVVNLDGSKNIPPHSTGAAIDVYLIDKTGKPVDMGILLDDTYQDIDGKYCKTDSNLISDEAKRYRKIMGDALASVGFVNYPTEYWHWSYGDRYWAYHTQQKHALYHSYQELG